jgi:hypothetical protein
MTPRVSSKCQALPFPLHLPEHPFFVMCAAGFKQIVTASLDKSLAVWTLEGVSTQQLQTASCTVTITMHACNMGLQHVAVPALLTICGALG